MARGTTKTTVNSPTASPLIFVSYSHRDEKFRERLMVHLAPLLREGVRAWVDCDMILGDEVDPTVMRALRTADLFVALASPDYLHSTYCFEKEYQFALRKAKRKKLHVLVAIARHCQWKHTRIGRYLVLPKDGKAIEDFGRRSQAFEQIVEGIRAVLKRIRSEREMVAEPPSKAQGSRASKTSTSDAQPSSGAKKARPAKARTVEKPAKAPPRAAVTAKRKPSARRKPTGPARHV